MCNQPVFLHLPLDNGVTFVIDIDICCALHKHNSAKSLL